MALPKLNVPVYEAILPSTEKVIKYRPFLVKEEKILLTALEADETKALSAAVKQIVNNCVQGELDVDNMPLFDIEYLFLNVRSKSVGETVEVNIVCPDDNKTSVQINKNSFFTTQSMIMTVLNTLPFLELVKYQQARTCETYRA